MPRMAPPAGMAVRRMPLHLCAGAGERICLARIRNDRHRLRYVSEVNGDDTDCSGGNSLLGKT